MKKYNVYLESSFISYLASKKSKNLTVASNQRASKEWWQHQKHHFDLFISPLVINEISQGNSTAARKRVELIQSLSLLEVSVLAKDIAQRLLDGGAFPHHAVADALHVGIATAYNIDFILTWNFKHLANVVAQTKMKEIINGMQLRLPAMCISQELLGG